MRLEAPDRTTLLDRLSAGQPTVLWRRLVADLDTPVSAYLKLAQREDYACLLESIEGGEVRGRYSIIGLKPDLIWRCFGDRAEINRHARYDPDAFEACDDGSLESFRTLAPKDLWTAQHGYRTLREMVCIVHHKRYGEVERHRNDILMIE